ncbi:prefoldin subunit 4 [Cladophialophora yegresii CBS 114405]|uniref:Prefoldin subunit 4 n=1 Tax=Cladophialophora yegresii CBS 114405 TaxID=1182544 RepID=W9WB54_9EURO|nr:prefoldin subunit 4 [Cladophialophora yegresii CBS 114405]EXJ61776.1 prefoldin subunit 4 [Cladophialophora yegresii CBS 114405]
MLSRRVLSREEESESTDAEVTKEDQDKINTFSRLHNRSKALEEELGAKQKDKEDLEELATELELADEDELIRYKIGDSFMHLPLSEAQDLLAEQTGEIESEVSTLEEQLEGIKEEISTLKAHLYARFGRGINLEA